MPVNTKTTTNFGRHAQFRGNRPTVSENGLVKKKQVGLHTTQLDSFVASASAVCIAHNSRVIFEWKNGVEQTLFRRIHVKLLKQLLGLRLASARL